MFRIALVSAGVAALSLAAGCQQSGEPVRLAEAAPEPVAEAAVLPTFALHYLDMGDTVRLAYGVANSDVVRLMMDCTPGAGQIALSDNAANGNVLLLASDGSVSRVEGVVEPGVTHEVVMAEAAPDTPALDGFRRTGRIKVGQGSAAYAIEAASFERHEVERFFAACEMA